MKQKTFINMDIFETLSKATKPCTEMMELDAIWLETPVVVDHEKKRRLTKGTLIRVENKKLTDGKATHSVTWTRGTIANTKFELTAIDLKTGELVNINF